MKIINQMITFKLAFTRHLLVVALLALALAVQAQNREVKMITSTDLITLHAGWNLISLDVIPTPATPEAVFAPLISASNLQMVTGFQNQQGVFFDPTGLPFLNTLAQVVTGEGYWVKVTNGTTLNVTGTAISPTFAINLKVGWNLIGYWSAETITPETAFASLITTGKLLMVTGYEQGGKFYDPNGLPFLNTLTEIKNGFGYWVKLNADFNGFAYPLQWHCGDLLTDERDGKTYQTVKIGNQCWMKQNLNVGTRIVGSSNQANNGIIEKYCSGNIESNCDIYGGLYQWNEMMQYLTTPGIQGICPPNGGWRIPEDDEWVTLTTLLGGTGVAGGKMKETGFAHWNSPNYGATNSSGFTGLPGGDRSTTSYFYSLHTRGSFWSSSEKTTNQAWERHLGYDGENVSRFGEDKSYGFSVRCVKDAITTPTVTTSALSNITPASAISGGNVISDGGAEVTARGVCWSTLSIPTIADSHTSDGNGTGTFTSYLTGLLPNTTYHVRAYATNSAGTDYGMIMAFSTNSQIVPGAVVDEPIDDYLATPAAGSVKTIPVVILRYLPTTDGVNVDVLKATDYYNLGNISLNQLKANIDKYLVGLKFSLEEGSKFHGYKNPAAIPYIGYKVLKFWTIYDQIPISITYQVSTAGGYPVFEPNFIQVYEDFGLQQYIEANGVKEIWLWMGECALPGWPSYDPSIHLPQNFVQCVESNMASPVTGDISNSHRFPFDIPIAEKTAVVYCYNFRRSQAEAVHNHGHQFESIYKYAAEQQDGNFNLFVHDFSGWGENYSSPPLGRAGDCHHPPNTTVDYDYLNTTLVESDIEDWEPAVGPKKWVNVSTWANLNYSWPIGYTFPQLTESQWYIYWMQNMPGYLSEIPYNSNYMTNWWQFTSDWDSSILNGVGLYSAFLPGLKGNQVGFNTDSSAFGNSPSLDMKSSGKGFLPAKVALKAANSADPLISPAIGLIVYNTATSGSSPNTITPGYYSWNGTCWVAAKGP